MAWSMDVVEKELTPIKSALCLSPSSQDICILCGHDLKQKYKGNQVKHGHKIKLWTGEGRKTEACLNVEKYCCGGKI